MATPFKTGEKILFGIFGVFIVLAVISFTILEIIRARSTKPMYEVVTHFDLSEEGKKGSALFRHNQCTDCHRAMRNGTNMSLSLDAEGSRRSQEWILQFLKEPEKVYESKTIDHGAAPKEAAYVAALPPETLHAIAVFLSQLRADQGASAAPAPPTGRSEFIDNMVKVWAPKDWGERYKDMRDAPQPEPTPAPKSTKE